MPGALIMALLGPLVADAQPPAGEANAPLETGDTPVVTAGEKGLSIASPDGGYELQLRGYVHGDMRSFVDALPHAGTDTFAFRRVRPILQLTLARHFLFRIMPEFGEGKGGEIQDAYVDLQPFPEAGLRAGKFRLPVGLERLQSASNLLFVERALTDNIVPNRQVGVAVHGEPWDGALAYMLGVFDGVENGNVEDADFRDAEVAGRVFMRPFLNGGPAALEGLGVGVSASFGDQSAARTLSSFKTTGRLTFFAYDVPGTVPDGARYRLSPQGYWYFGPFGLFAEYVLSSQGLRNGAATARADNDAWQVALSYVLTGEDASYEGVVPRAYFDPWQGGWGAFQLAARWSGLAVDGDVFPVFVDPARRSRAARAVAFGVNWYLNRNLKAMLDYERTGFDGGAANGADRGDEHVIAGRLQLSF